jgi:hypothetical protein
MYNEIKEIKLWKGDLGMRKIISIILVSSLLLLCLSGCSIFCNGDVNYCPAGKTDDRLVDKNSDLIKAIVSFMTEEDVDGNLPAPDLTYKINLIKQEGAELMEATFNAFDYYFVCAYSDNHEISSERYDEKAEYSWYRFGSADEIPEYYNGKKCVLAFQINKASSVNNLLINEDAPNIEHFAVYEPEFKKGFNARSPIAFDETVIYINGVFFDSANKNTVYLTTSSYFTPWATMPFVEFDGAKLLLLRHDYETIEEINLELVLGEYYDEFARFGRLDEYEIYLSDGSTFIYSLITLDDFVEVVKKSTAEG